MGGVLYCEQMTSAVDAGRDRSSVGAIVFGLDETSLAPVPSVCLTDDERNYCNRVPWAEARETTIAESRLIVA